MEPALTVILVTAAVLALIWPGVMAVSALCPGRPMQWRWITGATLGIAAALYASFFIAYADLRLFAPVWVLLGAGCFCAWRRRQGQGGRLFERPSRFGWMLLIALGLVATLRVGVVINREVPKGWDPAFHSILTQKILLTHRIITDWQPFEKIALNYPLGSHTLIAGISAATRQPPHQVFKLLLPMVGVLMTAEVYALATAASRRRGLGLLSAVAFGFLALLGSISYVQWGGMPNAVGMLLLLGYFRLLIERDFAARRLIMSLLIAAIIVTHHHVMITACIVMAGMIGWAILRGDRRMAGTILLTGIGGSVLALPYVAPYLMKAASLTSTAVLTDEVQPPLVGWLPQIGWVFASLMAAGAVLYGLRRLLRWHGKRHVQIHWTIMGVALLLVLLYVAAGMIYPAIQQSRGKPPLGAFTPSRFLTDAVPFAAIFAGYALYCSVRRRGWLRLGLVTALTMAATVTVLSAWGEMLEQDYPPALVRAYRWIDRNTPPQTILVSTDRWAPFLSWRKTLQTPVPISEPQSYLKDQWLLREYLGLVLGGGIAPTSTDLVVVQARPVDQPAGGRVLQQDEGYAVEQLWPTK